MKFSAIKALHSAIASHLRSMEWDANPDGRVVLVCHSIPRSPNSDFMRDYEYIGFLWRQSGTMKWFPNTEAGIALGMKPGEFIFQDHTLGKFDSGLVKRFVSDRGGINDTTGFFWFRRVKVEL